MVHRYTIEQLDYLREKYKLLTVPELTKAFNEKFSTNTSDVAMQSLLAYYAIRCGRTPRVPKGKKPPKYTRKQLIFLREGYKSMLTHELTQAFNKKFRQQRTVQAIQGQLTLKGFRKDRKEGMPSSVPREIGSERICPNTGFIVLKIAESYPRRGGDSRQKHKHKVMWEKQNGPIPLDHTIRFLDGNKQNCDIDNLMMFNRAENMHLNLMGFDLAPPELKESIILRARLIGKIAERKKELDD
jgi:hypothetical protein